MFAIEIDFNDGVSQPETMLVRRPQMLIGASEFAHVVIDDMKDLNIELRVIREKGRRLRCKPTGPAEAITRLGLADRVYENQASLRVGSISLLITPLDSDLLYREGEAPDRAGVRILQSASSLSGPEFPAVLVMGANPIVVSFAPGQVIGVGRSNQNLVRLDSPEISNQHARIGFESGTFWIEDMGSTNGTWIDQQQVGGRVVLRAGVPVVVGREVSLVAVDSDELLRNLLGAFTEKQAVAVPQPASRKTYPALVCVSEGARPSRVSIMPETTCRIGRDPSSDMWLGVPHVSRMHCSVYRGHDDELVVRDNSTNGTAYDEGILEKGESLSINGSPKVLDFGGGVTVGICFTEDQEKAFIESGGSAAVFSDLRAQKKSDRGSRSFASLSGTLEPYRAGTSAPRAERRTATQNFAQFYGMLDQRTRSLFFVTVGLAVSVLVLVVHLVKSAFLGG